MKSNSYMVEKDRDSEKQLAVLQEKVKTFWPKLTVNPALAKPFKMNKGDFEVYLSQFREKKHSEAVRRFITTHLRNISQQELLDNLRKCVIKLNTKEPENMMLLVQQYHSQQWVAELALRHLNDVPMGCINMDSYDFSWDLRSLKGASTLLMCDDCSYTGTQLQKFILPQLFEALSKTSEKTSLKVFFIIPFITKPALERALQTCKQLTVKYEKSVDINLDIIYEEIIPTIGDLPVDKEDKPLLVEALGAASYENMEKFVMITTDWKGAPDYMSFIPSISNASVDYTVNKYDGWEIAKLPEHIKNAKPFLPKVTTPYSREYAFTQDDSTMYSGF